MMDLKTHLFTNQNLIYSNEKKAKVLFTFLVRNQRKYFNSKLKPLYTAFLNSIKHSKYRIGIKFDKDHLAVEQNNYLSKI